MTVIHQPGPRHLAWLAALKREFTPDEWERFEERAAIMEYDGGLSRGASEVRAAAIIRGTR